MAEGSFLPVLMSFASVLLPLLFAWFLIVWQARRRRRRPRR
jgi:hypothetical protein